jgi:hypothetical protein
MSIGEFARLSRLSPKALRRMTSWGCRSGLSCRTVSDKTVAGPLSRRSIFAAKHVI